MTRNDCRQKVYGGCAGPTCDRDCITARIIDLDARIAEEQSSMGFRSLVGVGLMAAMFAFGAMSLAEIIVENNKTHRSANADV